MKRIAVFTGGRADWGLLAMPALALSRRGIAITIIATGQHAGSEGTVDLIRQDGFDDIRIVPIDLSSDSGASLAAATGAMQSGLADALLKAEPQMLVILGDRYEALAAALTATLMRIPIAHIAGGDLTEGAIDDAMRHAITKLSHIHFVTTADARRRLLAMGEQPEHVLLSGSPGIDRMLATPPMERDVFFDRVGLKPCPHNAVITFHPETHASDPAAQADAMLKALAQFDGRLGFLFTGVNADPGYRAVADSIAKFVSDRPHAVLHNALGGLLYTNALRHCDVVIGNSSSGLYEAPTFQRPTVNIGERQRGRLRARSVIDVPAEAGSITGAIEQALAGGWHDVENPYGDGRSSERIADVLAAITDPQALLRKVFHESLSA